MLEFKSETIDYGLRLKPNRDIGYFFSDKHISINTQKADLQLGVGEKALNEHLSKKLNELYKSKMTKAFQELKSLRAKQNLSDF